MGVDTIEALVDSYCDWWTRAGVVDAVQDTPAGWLDAPVRVAAPARDSHAADARAAAQLAEVAPSRARNETPSPPVPTPAAPLTMPSDPLEFAAWLATGPDVPGAGWDVARVLPQGPVGASLMVMALCPEMDDMAAAQPFAGRAGKLLDAMLAAIGLDRDHCYVATLASTRPPGGRIDADHAPGLRELFVQHLRVARPRRVLLVGNDMAALAADTSLAGARGRLLYLNHDGTKVETVAIPHPELLLARPTLKRAAWDSLKLLRQGT